MNPHVSEEVVVVTDGYETTMDLMALTQSERAVSSISANDAQLNRGSSRLEIILNPRFENFERFLKSLIEVEQ